MKSIRWIAMVLITIALAGCSVMPKAVKEEALPPTPFPELIADAARYRGETVIVGGYVLEVINEQDATRIIALQAPLGSTQKPRDKDLSQGRLILTVDRFLDPEVYAKNRKFTAAGRITGSSATERDDKPYPYLRIEASEIHLWPMEAPRPIPNPYWDPWYPYYDPFWGPFRYSDPWWWRHPYRWR